MEEFKECIKDFAVRNISWIQKVGRDVLLKSQLTIDSFVKGLVGGTIMFDELCLTVACTAFNIHCIVPLDESFWTTCPNNQLNDCVLHLAFVGDYGFKEICAKNTAAIDKKITEEYDESDDSSGQEELHDTGILNEQTDVKTGQQESSDSVDPDAQQIDVTTGQQESSDSVDRGVKPFIRFKANFDVTFNNEPIVILDSEDEEQHDVKPVIKFTPTVTVTGEPTVISSDSEPETQPDKDNIDANSTVPQIPRQHRIKHDRKYSCYLCDQKFEMQASFLDHFKTDHANNK